MILGGGPALKQQLAAIVENEDGEGSVKQPLPVRLELFGNADLAVIGINEHDRLNARCLHSLVLHSKANACRREYTDNAPTAETTGAFGRRASQVAVGARALSLRTMPEYVLIRCELGEGWIVWWVA